MRLATSLLALLTLLTGVVYPLVVTGAAQLAFPDEANGSLVEVGDRVVGSRLIGQAFDDDRYFWGRPSATRVVPYDAAASAASNLGPTNPALLARVRARVDALRAAHPDRAGAPVPADLVTASASGLDPHISPAAALYQVQRVARARGLPEPRVRELVRAHLEGRTLGLFGEPRVNVLLLNLALDRLAQGHS
ncbi:MAG: potassium-transporting ATPase subunit KdpC [Kofleriaceae bacterium]